MIFAWETEGRYRFFPISIQKVVHCFFFEIGSKPNDINEFLAKTTPLTHFFLIDHTGVWLTNYSPPHT